MKIDFRPDYARRRAAEYPSSGDALDAVFKALQAVRDGKPLPAEALRWIAACEAVKTRFPKPTSAT